jgi:transposase
MSSSEQRKIYRYSISFKQMVVREIEAGNGLEFIRKKYEIGGGATIQGWVKKFGKQHLLNKLVKIETMPERDKLKQLEQENKKLKIALADAFLAKDCLEEVIKIANEEYRTDLKKNFGGELQDNLKDNTK